MHRPEKRGPHHTRRNTRPPHPENTDRTAPQNTARHARRTTARHAPGDAPAAASGWNAAASFPPSSPQPQPRARETCARLTASPEQIVELAHLDALNERGDLRMGVYKRGTLGVPRIPDG